MSIRRRPFSIVMLALLSACGTTVDRVATEKLCEFRQRPRPSVMLHYDRTSQVYLGEIDVKAFAAEADSVASAVAKPIKSSYRREYRADCRNKVTGAWYPCTKTVEVDLSKVEVIVRGFDMDRVAKHAVDMCDKHTLTLIPVEGDLRRLSQEFRCGLAGQAYCPLK